MKKLLIVCTLALALTALGDITVADFNQSIKITQPEGIHYLRKSAIVKISTVREVVTIEYNREDSSRSIYGIGVIRFDLLTSEKAKVFADDLAELVFAKADKN